jgi:hypothetical protein
VHKVIETLKGKGRLTSSAEPGPQFAPDGVQGSAIDYAVAYELHVVQEEIAAPTRQNIHATEPGSSAIVATIHFSHLGNGPVFADDQQLILHLDDGRKIPLVWKGYGLFQATGPFF